MAMHAARMVAAVAVLGLAGCAQNYHRLYEGPMRPRQSVAILTNGINQLRVVAIDNHRFPLAGPPLMAFELLPGPHTVTVGYRDAWVSGRTMTVVTARPWVLRFHAAAGKRYQIAKPPRPQLLRRTRPGHPRKMAAGHRREVTDFAGQSGRGVY
jgi:hypothetical protein